MREGLSTRLALEDVRFAYRGTDVVRGVSATARAGRITALVGPNAAGKSTLLRLMVGALRPAAGSITLEGRDVGRLRPRQRARRLAYVAQRPLVAGALTVRHVIELGRYALGPAPERIDEVLDRLELDHLAGRAYGALSVGQQQRVALARALVQHDPAGALLLDEPTAAMDLRHEIDARRLLRESADSGGAVVVVVHDLARTATWADDAWLLRDGCLAAAGPAGEVLEPERLRSVFEVPFERISLDDGRSFLVVRAAEDCDADYEVDHRARDAGPATPEKE